MYMDEIINEDVSETIKVSFFVTFETETFDDGDVAVFISDNGGYFQYSKVFKDIRHAEAAIDNAKLLFKRKPWDAIEELKLNGFTKA